MWSLVGGDHELNYDHGEKLAWWHACQLQANSNLKQYLKMKEYLAKENYDLIEEHNFFKEFQVDND